MKAHVECSCVCPFYSFCVVLILILEAGVFPRGTYGSSRHRLNI